MSSRSITPADYASAASNRQSLPALSRRPAITSDSVIPRQILSEQDPGLDVAPIGPRVMDDAAERVVHPDRIEQGERTRLAGREGPHAVRHFVTHLGQLRHREVPRQFGGSDVAAYEFLALLQGVGVG